MINDINIFIILILKLKKDPRQFSYLFVALKHKYYKTFALIYLEILEIPIFKKDLKGFKKWIK